MTLEEALEIVDKIIARAQLDRRGHQVASEAIETLADSIVELRKKNSEVKSP